jgi:hypothetical protein
MTLLKKQKVDVYTNQNKVLKTVRLDIESAKKWTSYNLFVTHIAKSKLPNKNYI